MKKPFESPIRLITRLGFCHHSQGGKFSDANVAQLVEKIAAQVQFGMFGQGRPVPWNVTQIENDLPNLYWFNGIYSDLMGFYSDLMGY